MRLGHIIYYYNVTCNQRNDTGNISEKFFFIDPEMIQ